MAFFAELRRRKVFRVGAAYLVVGWLVVQAASIALPAFDAPEWALRVFILCVLLGFPIALVLAWVFDITPEGVQVTEGTVGERRFYSIVAVLAVVAVAWFFLGQPAYKPERPAATGPPSIAVLPFVNMSPDPENEFFADGISEELLNILAGIDGLSVASRTSAFAFKGSDRSIPEIARQLNVAHVLEGSVRRQGDRVRITAQLIDAGTDMHLWSETYDRDLEDIFRVQEEIAVAITQALEEVLGTREVAMPERTRDLEAYDHFLRGRTRFYDRSELDLAVEDFKHAVRRDRSFAEAWGYLAAVSSTLESGGYPSDLDRTEMLELSNQAADRALALEPDMPIALAVKGMQAKDIEQSIDYLRRAAERESDDTTGRLWYAIAYLQAGFHERAIPLLEDARRSDPLVGVNAGYLATAYMRDGRDAEAERLARQAAEMGWPFAAWLIATEYANRGEWDKVPGLSRPILEQQVYDEATVEELLGMLTEDPGDSGKQEILELAGFEEPDFMVLFFYGALFADADRLFEAIMELYAERFRANAILPATQLAWLPSLDWMREDPRFFELIGLHAIPAYWESHGYPMDCVPVEGPGGKHLDCP